MPKRLAPDWLLRIPGIERLLERLPDLKRAPWLRRAWLFLRLLVGKANRDGIAMTAAGLAFITMLSLVPLLAALSLTGARFFQGEILDMLVRLLPYSEESIVLRMNAFLEEAKKVRGPGAIAFFVAALVAINYVAEAFNRIWEAEPSRVLRARLLSLTLFLFWGPVVVGAVVSALALLRQRPELATVLEAPIWVQLLPPTVIFMGLTMLYWQVPSTRVELRCAAFGGAVATLLLEGLRQGFGLYIDLSQNVSRVYGSLAFAFLFVVSLQLAWYLVLLGNEVAFVSQRFATLAATHERRAPIQPQWLGLAILAKLVDRLHGGEPLTPVEDLAGEMNVPMVNVRRALMPLADARLVREIRGGEVEGLLLSHDPHQMTLDRVFACYEPGAGRSSDGSELPLDRLGEIRRRVQRARRTSLDGLTLADLAAKPAESVAEEEASESSEEGDSEKTA